MNFQSCARTIFVGVNHSFESWYQAIRRFWRFGQSRPVHCHVVVSEAEGAVLANLRRKQVDAEKMADAMRVYTLDLVREEMGATARQSVEYAPRVPMKVPSWLKSEGNAA